MSLLLAKAATYAHGAATLISWVGKDARVVTQKEAQTRADTCLKCPLRIPTPKALGWAADSIKRILELKSKLALKVVGEKAIGLCSACSCVNRLKVWMPLNKVRKELSADELSRLDAKCWITTENE